MKINYTLLPVIGMISIEGTCYPIHSGHYGEFIVVNEDGDYTFQFSEITLADDMDTISPAQEKALEHLLTSATGTPKLVGLVPRSQNAPMGIFEYGTEDYRVAPVDLGTLKPVNGVEPRQVGTEEL